MAARTVGLATATLCVLATLPTAPAGAATTPVPSLRIVAAQVAGADENSYHLRVALMASCSPTKFDTAGLLVNSTAPAGGTEDALECTNQEVTDIVTIKSPKGRYMSGKQVTVTAVLRSVEKQVLLTTTRTLAIQAG